MMKSYILDWNQIIDVSKSNGSVHYSNFKKHLEELGLRPSAVDEALKTTKITEGFRVGVTDEGKMLAFPAQTGVWLS